MSTRPPTPGLLSRVWFQWKSIRLPWRNKWLVGSDLSGNTFWEFKDALNANRLRRIVHYNPKAHFGDIQITPQWHQWLRHTRLDAPSINEQQLDEVRQAQIKKLAAAADARWEAQESFLVAPEGQGQSNVPDIRSTPAGIASRTVKQKDSGLKGGPESTPARAVEGQSPRQPGSTSQTGNQSTEQPGGWTPKSTSR
ncbi:hypothetical protein P152DRAFT_394688 [Eremomyces bilateralis CBS 781.70]|uniref:Uncharacterized protein n=1 Tax=Eremomyces bilateralis CBS 781.70 TaxID=1392243 RepID=A0A6G1G6N4_9PEZI|nr:uncharacterized protein P152DRAFT_394688 [Eremomyces bilateralis CBS 781.70]KAF1813621.1 hypothetical protein P152DRAFT_394688 [Eremomyces bilateralis CBS 781.70]